MVLEGEDEAAAILIHGDARTELSHLPNPADVILTDPVWPQPLPELHGSDDPHGLLAATLAQAPRVKRIIIQLRCDSDPRILNAVPSAWPFLRTVWLPYAVPHYRGRVLISGDVGYVFGEPPPSREGLRVLPGQPHAEACPRAQPQDSRSLHPCPRNLAHVEWLVEKLTAPGETVLDPFMGSGTTGVACLRRGRRFMGIDIDPGSFAEAEQRLRAEHSGLWQAKIAELL